MSLATAACAASLIVVALFTLPELKVEPNQQNVVASRIVGEWVPDEELGSRLGTKARFELTFKEDSSALQQVPDQQAAFVKDKTIYFAGRMQRISQEKGAIETIVALIEQSGNPHLAEFRSRSGSGPIDDGESAIIMLAPAKDRANDILFFGGDFNNEPFRAWKRKSESR